MSPDSAHPIKQSFATKKMLNPTRKDAISFVDKVKSQFEGDSEKYDTFLDIMRDLKEDLIDPSEVVLQITELFDQHPDLVQEFNVFLPPGYLLHPQGEGKASHMLLSTPE